MHIADPRCGHGGQLRYPRGGLDAAGRDGDTGLPTQRGGAHDAHEHAVPREFGWHDHGGAATERPPGAYRLYVVYADNCAGVRPAAGQTNPPPSDDPNTPPGFVPVTDTNLYYAYSDDRGKTWVGGDGHENGRQYNSCGAPGSFPASGRLLAKPGPDTAATGSYPDDQWFPWIDASPASGIATAVTMDGNTFDGEVRETYGFTGWAGATPTATPDFEPLGNLSGPPSHPRQSRFFRTAAVDPDHSCPDCTRFLGDYNGVAVDRLDRIHAMWTDMRRTVCDPDEEAEDTDLPTCPSPGGIKGEDAYYAQRPITPIGQPSEE